MALFAGQVQTAPYQSPDYGPSVSAAREYANAQAQIIPGMITKAGDYFKQQKEGEKSVNTASRIAGLLAAKAPDLVPGIGDLQRTLDDKEIPLSQRISAAEELFSTMRTGFEVNQMINQNAMMGLRQQQAQQALANSGGGNSAYIVK